MASGSPVDDGSWRNAMSSNLAARPASRRSSKRALQCDDDMSSDDAPLVASVPPPPASSPTSATCSTLFGTYSLASRLNAAADPAPPKRKAETAPLQPDLLPPTKSATTESARALPGVTSKRANQQVDVPSALPQRAQCNENLIEKTEALLKKGSTVTPPAVVAAATAARVRQPVEANTAQLPRTAAKPKERAGDTQQEATSGETMSVSARVGECKARITDLQKQKAALLDKEDYIGAHHMKEKVQQQEQLLLVLKR